MNCYVRKNFKIKNRIFFDYCNRLFEKKEKNTFYFSSLALDKINNIVQEN